MGTLFATTFVFLLSATQIIHADSTSQHKNSPLGFQGMRGKRNVDTISSTSDEDSKEFLKNDGNYQNVASIGDVIATRNPDIMSSLSQGGVSGESHINDLKGVAHYYDEFPDLTLYKRAPMGFMGMRGKKDSEYTNYHKRAAVLGLNDNFLLNYPIRYMSKRTPSGFFGMRGKKFYGDGLLGYTDYDIKRAPSGFMGMRGKKENLNDWTDDSSSFENDVQWMETIEAERDLLRDIERLYELQHFDDEMHMTNEEKRVPSGFMGMRGKKLITENDNFEENYNQGAYYKRDPSSGFFGMRGKKSEGDDIVFGEDKRVPMGFHGMRGKRDVNSIFPSDEIEEIKRVPAGFFGMRGKKQPNGSGFFGMRGKKGPYDYRDFNRFVGVRGKKVPYGRIRQLQSDVDSELGAPGYLSSNLMTDKRVPSGFYGVRGKKWLGTSSEDDK